MTTIPWESRPVVGRRSATARLTRPDPWSLGAPALAAGLVALGIAVGWRGGDLPAQIYRIESFRRHGLALWDSQWFAGHWSLGYSVLEPAVASLLGLTLLSVLCAALATAGYQRLAAAHFPTGAARASALVFAASVIVETSIGQIPYLAGETVGLWGLVALVRRRPWLAAAGAAGSALLSPLAAAFVALAAGAWFIANWWPTAARRVTGLARPRPAAERAPLSDWVAAALRRPGTGTAIAVLVAVGAPLGAVGLLFPGQGPMPYPAVDCGWELALAGLVYLVTPASQPVVRVGIRLWALAAVASVLEPSALGGNVGRVEDTFALPLTVALIWSAPPPWLRPLRRLPARLASPGARGALLGLIAVPLVLSQWGPAWGPMTSDAGHPWTTQGYYAPVAHYLQRVAGSTGRVEVVPTADHWESAYVAPDVALARGWERQLDIADNPVFYTEGALNDASYLGWLHDNGVGWVALPAAPLDYAGAAEGRLVAAGVPGLRPVWHDRDWRVYRVEGSTGIVSGPGYLSHMDGSQMTLVAERAGTIEVRVHDSPAWRVTEGSATLAEADDGWMLVQAAEPGPVHLVVGLAVP